MKTVPFKRFVQAYLFYGERFPKIIERLSGFDFSCNESDLAPILDECAAPLPQSLASKFNNTLPFNPYTDDFERQWLEKLGLYEFFDFIMRRKQTVDLRPDYFKWFNDCLWILSNQEVTCIVNILMFNNEPFDSISDIITCKYKKKIGVEALTRYRHIFWDTSACDAKDTLRHYIPFRSNTMIVKMRSGHETEIEKWDSVASDGSDTPIAFHDSNYIKWKIGYKKIEVPKIEDFLEQVKRDSYFKYYEAMNMIRSAEEESEDGMNEKIGQFSVTKRRLRNVEEQKAKAAKAWLDMYIRANRNKPIETKMDEDIFAKMNALKMEFDTEKLVSINDNPTMFEDIRKDL